MFAYCSPPPPPPRVSLFCSPVFALLEFWSCFALFEFRSVLCVFALSNFSCVSRLWHLSEFVTTVLAFFVLVAIFECSRLAHVECFRIVFVVCRFLLPRCPKRGKGTTCPEFSHMSGTVPRSNLRAPLGPLVHASPALQIVFRGPFPGLEL